MIEEGNHADKYYIKIFRIEGARYISRGTSCTITAESLTFSRFDFRILFLFTGTLRIVVEHVHYLSCLDCDRISVGFSA